MIQSSLHHNKNMESSNRSHSLPVLLPPASSLGSHPPREEDKITKNPEDVLSRFSGLSQFDSLESSLPNSILLSPLNAKKSVLAQAYSHQINQKQAERQNQYRLRISQERDMLSHLAEQEAMAKRIKKEKRERERMQAIQDMNRRQAIRESQQRQEAVRENKLVRQNSLENKLVSFRSYYNNKLKASQNRDKMYLDFIERQKKHRQQKQVSDREYMQMKHRMVQRQIAEQTKARTEQKNSLRSALQKQLEQQQASRLQQKIEQRKSPFQIGTNKRHNPITNPIDYQMDIRNPYLIRQLAHQQH